MTTGTYCLGTRFTLTYILVIESTSNAMAHACTICAKVQLRAHTSIAAGLLERHNGSKLGHQERRRELA